MTDARATLDAAMTEAQLFEAVRAHLDAFGWLWYHTYDSRRSNGGFPDIVAVREGIYHNGRILFIELKREGGNLSPAQELWHVALKGAEGRLRHEVYVWRPSDLSSGEIEKCLR